MENHPFWALFLSQRPTCIRDGDRGSSRIRIPTWNERVQPGRKEPKIHSSLRAEAENTCWVCLLQHGPVNLPFPALAKTYIETTPFHNIPVCNTHYELDLCHCCLQLDSEADSLNLHPPLDYDSFEIDDAANAAACERCRVDAFQNALNQFPIRFQPPYMFTTSHLTYLRSGRGTAAGTVENLYATWFAQEYLGLEDEYTDAMEKLKAEIKVECHRRRT